MGTAMPVPHHRRVPGLLAVGLAALLAVGIGYAALTDDPPDDATAEPSLDELVSLLALGDTPAGIDGAVAGPSSAMPALAPTGTGYRSCVTDYGAIDWNGGPRKVIEAHRRAATAPCTAPAWYRDTAFQNGILTFMLLVGEEELAAAAPDGDEPTDLAASLAAQGFDRLATLEIASSGWCHAGEVQVALATLTSTGSEVRTPGLAAIVAKAEAAGAVIDRGPAMTVLTGGDVPCATAIVHADDVVGWVTAADGATVRAAVARLALQ